MATKVRRDGEEGQVVLPPGMTWDQLANVAKTQKELEGRDDKEITIVETIDRFTFEAAYALNRAAHELFGVSLHHDKMNPDGSITFASLIGVPISATETVQVPWGPFHLPDIEGELVTSSTEENGRIVMQLQARVKHKYRDQIKKLADRTREIAEKESIYRGKAIRIRFRDDEGKLEVSPPSFMDLSSSHSPIFSKKVTHEVDKHLLLPIRKAEAMRKFKLPLKRGILLSGTFGCGKTLTAHMVAKEATAVGRTFIYAQNALEITDALRFAMLYQPAVVFVEDIDRALVGPRTKEMDEILNTFDGVDTKDAEIITVITTNDIHMIHPAFLRHGRVDKIIEIDQLDEVAVEGLLRHFGGDLLNQKVVLTNLVPKLVERTAAFIREVVESAKLESVFADEDADIKLSAKDLELAFHNIEDERGGLNNFLNEEERLKFYLNELIKAGAVRAPGR